MKQTYGVNQCFLLQINSRPLGQEAHVHLPDPWNQFLTKRFEGQVNVRNCFDIVLSEMYQIAMMYTRMCYYRKQAVIKIVVLVPP